MCLSPRLHIFEDALGKHAMSVPCGHCLECQKDYQDSWKVRLCHEFTKYCVGVFVTLTYNEETVPYLQAYEYVDENTGEVTISHTLDISRPFRSTVFSDSRAILKKSPSEFFPGRDGKCRTVWKKDVQLWIKRGRTQMMRDYGENYDFSYYCTSEYSPRWLRPHYHLLFFGIDLDQFNKYFGFEWQRSKGYTFASQIHYDLNSGDSPASVCNYVTKYCSKGSFENPRVAEGTVMPTFHLCSKGIGKEWIVQNIARYVPDVSQYQFDVTKLPFEYVFRKYLHFNKRGVEVVHRIVSTKIYNDEKTNKKRRVLHAEGFVRKTPSLSDSYLACLSENYCCSFEDIKSKTSYKYKLPRYYKDYISAYSPSLYSQVADYQRRYVESLREADVQNIAIQLGISLSQAYFEYDKRQKVRKDCKKSRIYKSLSRFYSRAIVA